MFAKKIEKKKIPFNYSVGRDFKERPKTSVGPGSYNIEKNNQSFKDEKNHNFNRKEGSHSLAKFKKINRENTVLKH